MLKKRPLLVALIIWIGLLFTLAVSSQANAEPLSRGQVSDQQLRRMIGQMVLVGFTGDNPDNEGVQTVLAQAHAGSITGVMYLKRNINDLGSVRALNLALQSASKTPLLIAIDQEGGRVQRLTPSVGFKDTPSAANIGKSVNLIVAKAIYEDLASHLAALGFNVNFGPVVDLNVNPANPIIGKIGRSYSADPEKVTGYAMAFVGAHRDHGLLTALKHFPGHGSSTKDSHKGTVDVTKTWRKTELRPFENLIFLGDAEMIMSSHVINNNLSSDDIPASLSRKVLTDVLRKQLGFKGVIVSDDMQMDAIRTTRSLEDAVVQAVTAGNDILIFANDKHPDPQVPEKIAAILIKKAKEDPAMLARIRNASANVSRLKSRLAAPVRASAGKGVDQATGTALPGHMDTKK